jgi:hypothetical protein
VPVLFFFLTALSLFLFLFLYLKVGFDPLSFSGGGQSLVLVSLIAYTFGMMPWGCIDPNQLGYRREGNVSRHEETEAEFDPSEKEEK